MLEVHSIHSSGERRATNSTCGAGAPMAQTQVFTNPALESLVGELLATGYMGLSAKLRRITRWLPRAGWENQEKANLPSVGS